MSDTIGTYLNQLFLLIACTYLYGFAYRYLRAMSRPAQAILTGALFGIFGFLNMLLTITLVQGTLYDLRTVTISMAAIFGGPISGIVAALAVILYRLTIGGIGVVAGIGSVITALLTGCWFHRMYHQRSMNPAIFIPLGLLLVLNMFMWIATQPIEIAAAVLTEIALPSLITYPVAVWMWGMLIRQHHIQRETEESLAQERNILRALIDNIPDTIFIKDRYGRFLVSNRANDLTAGAVFPGGLIGKRTEDVFPPEIADQFRADDERVLQGHSIIQEERTSLNIQRQQITVATTKVPLYNSLGRVVGIVGINHDISRRKLMEQQSAQLEKDRMHIELLRRFISDVSHDFRTPLSVIGTTSYLMYRSDETERRKELYNRVNDEIKRLDSLLASFLDATHLADDETALNLGNTNVLNTVENVITSLKTVADRKGLMVALSAGRGGMRAIADENALHRVLFVLLENAINYTPSGGCISVLLYLAGKEVAIQIHDTGIGITPEDLPHIFEHFFRGDLARSTETGGSGLGLTIAKSLVEHMHGRIEVSSTPGLGSTFTVLLQKPVVSNE